VLVSSFFSPSCHVHMVKVDYMDTRTGIVCFHHPSCFYLMPAYTLNFAHSPRSGPRARDHHLQPQRPHRAARGSQHTHSAQRHRVHIVLVLSPRPAGFLAQLVQVPRISRARGVRAPQSPFRVWVKSPRHDGHPCARQHRGLPVLCAAPAPGPSE